MDYKLVLATAEFIRIIATAVSGLCAAAVFFLGLAAAAAILEAPEAVCELRIWTAVFAVCAGVFGFSAQKLGAWIDEQEENN